MADRWSAMQVGIEAWLNGKHHYTSTDHLDGRTSNFPGLFIIGFIPYFLGNIGLLQVLNLILLVVVLRLYFPLKKVVLFLSLLFISPAFWWEVYVSSDLMTNIFIVLMFILLIDKFQPNIIFKKPILLGVFLSFLILTRGIVLIPLALYFTKDFFKIQLSSKLKLMFSGLTFGSLLIFLVLMNVPDQYTLLNYNPLLLQTSQVPTSMIILSLILPFGLSLINKGLQKNYFEICVLLFLFPILIGFFIKLYLYGFNATLIDSRFDISYLSMLFPFLIPSLLKSVFNLTPKNP